MNQRAARESVADWHHTIPRHVPVELVHPFDHIAGEEVHQFPPTAIEPHRSRPIFYSPLYGGFWVLTQYTDIRAVLQDADLFRQVQNGTVPPIPQPRNYIPHSLDPPDHLPWRQAMLPLFAPGRLDALGAELRSTARDAAERVAPLGHCDFLADYARALPVARFCRQLGLPADHVDEFFHLGDELIYGTDRVSVSRGADAAKAHRFRYGAAIEAILEDLLERRREAEPGEDIVSQLIATTFNGRRLTDDEILNIIGFLFFAGTDSTSGAMAYATMHLATHPHDRRIVIEQPHRWNDFVEELLRLHSVHFLARRASRDTTVADAKIKEGDLVMLPTCAAGRDPNIFDEPSRFNPDRPDKRHFAFGVGPHRCLGIHQARMEITIALEEFHRAVPDYVLDETQPIEFVCGPKSRPRAVPLVY
jgi:cytochrome P450